MSILEWIFIGCLAGAVLALLFFCYCLLQFVIINKKLQQLPARAPKNKRKRKRWRNRSRQLTTHKKRILKWAAVWLLLTGCLAGGSGYISFYQATNLSTDDSDAIVRSYFLLRDFEEQLVMAGEQQGDEEGVSQNIQYLAQTMATYGVKQASTLNTPEGQLALNRYYKAVTEIGVNASQRIKEFYGDPELAAEYQEDLARVIKYEKAAFDFFKVNEEALQKE